MVSRRLEKGRENEYIPSQVEQVHQGAQGDQVPIVGGGNEVPLVPLQMTNGELERH